MSEQHFTRPNVQPVITYIGTTPEQRQMSTDEFKAKFDEMTVNLQNYIKETLLTELDEQFEQINNKLQYFQPPKSVPYDSGDNAWKTTTGIHFYYIGSDGIASGYPSNTAMLVHMRIVGGSLVFQQCWGSSGKLWYRRVPGSTSMADAEWVKIG